MSGLEKEINRLRDENCMVQTLIGPNDCRFKNMGQWASWITENTKYIFGEISDTIITQQQNSDEAVRKLRKEATKLITQTKVDFEKA